MNVLSRYSFIANYQVEKIMLIKSNEVLINDIYDFCDLTKKDGDGTAVVIGIKGNVYYIKFDYIDSFNQLIVRENVNINKSIYDLKQGSRQWYFKFHGIISSFGFDENPRDQCIYHKIPQG